MVAKNIKFESTVQAEYHPIQKNKNQMVIPYRERAANGKKQDSIYILGILNSYFQLLNRVVVVLLLQFHDFV